MNVILWRSKSEGHHDNGLFLGLSCVVDKYLAGRLLCCVTLTTPFSGNDHAIFSSFPMAKCACCLYFLSCKRIVTDTLFIAWYWIFSWLVTLMETAGVVLRWSCCFCFWNVLDWHLRCLWSFSWVFSQEFLVFLSWSILAAPLLMNPLVSWQESWQCPFARLQLWKGHQSNPGPWKYIGTIEANCHETF